MTPSFNRIFKAISSKRDGISYTAEEALNLWRTFIEDCKDGYSWTIFEYYNELNIRTIIEEVLQDPDLKQFDDYEKFLAEIFNIDEKFKKVVLSKDYFTGNYWWETKLPKIGFGDFIKTLKEAYNVTDVQEIK